MKQWRRGVRRSPERDKETKKEGEEAAGNIEETRGGEGEVREHELVG